MISIADVKEGVHVRVGTVIRQEVAALLDRDLDVGECWDEEAKYKKKEGPPWNMEAIFKFQARNAHLIRNYNSP